jgi:hypothetical protein
VKNKGFALVVVFFPPFLAHANADADNNKIKSDQDQQGPDHERLLKNFQAMPAMKNKDLVFDIFIFLSFKFHAAASAASNPLYQISLTSAGFQSQAFGGLL